jgi:diguanylate cyclase (GGDEF)-like protein
VAALALWATTISGWALAGIAMLLARTERQAFLATSAIFLGICTSMAVFYCVSLASIDRGWRCSRRLVLLLAIEPAAVMVALATNHWHHLFIRRFEQGLQGTLVPDFGVLFWVHVVYAYGILVAGVVRMGRASMRAGRGQRWVFGWVPAAVVPPMIANLVGLSLAGRTVDLTVVGWAVTVVIAYSTVVRQSLPELVPVARRRVFDTISDAVAVVDRAGRLLDVNPAGERLLRRMCPELPATLLGTAPLGLESGLLAVPEAGDADQLLVDVNGTGVDVHVRISSVLDRRGRCTGWVLVARDVTQIHRQRHQLEEANARLQAQLHTIERLRADLAEQAVRDVLTGLHNRRYLLEVLDREVPQAVRTCAPLSLAMVDLDHFKAINDRYGHVVGDAVLVLVGQVLRDEVRQSDVLVRYGGEEFVLVLPGVGADQAQRRLDALREQVSSAALAVSGHAVSVTFSAGVASVNGSEDPAELIAAADQALYEAKRRGRNRVVLSVAGAAHPP